MIEEIENKTINTDDIDNKKQRKRSSKKYPKISLKKALKIAQSINDNNAGEPFNRLTLAKALNTTPSSSKFRTMITTSSKHGLTIGGYSAEKISLTELGRSIVQPTSEKEYLNSLKQALFNIPLFEKIFQKYNSNKLPEKEILENILHREYNIPKETTEQCFNIIIKNATELEIIDKIQGKIYINLEKMLTSKEPGDEEAKPEDLNLDQPQENNGVEDVKGNTKEDVVNYQIENKPKVFIGHSKNKKILTQIKEILDFGQFNLVVAEDVETLAVPIPEKIFKLMRECNCAIINISADKKEKLPDETYKINENVLIEIGASFLAYNQKVILLVDKRIELPSNLQGLYRCEYEGDELSWETAMKLQRALKEFRKPDI